MKLVFTFFRRSCRDWLSASRPSARYRSRSQRNTSLRSSFDSLYEMSFTVASAAASRSRPVSNSCNQHALTHAANTGSTMPRPKYQRKNFTRSNTVHTTRVSKFCSWKYVCKKFYHHIRNTNMVLLHLQCILRVITHISHYHILCLYPRKTELNASNRQIFTHKIQSIPNWCIVHMK